MKTHLLFLASLPLVLASVPNSDAAEFKFKAIEIDKIEIGYGLQIADVNGDGKVDILLADKKTIQWYEAPEWTKHIIARDLTERDNVCITARDIDGDGKCEIVVGAQWNPGETTDPAKSGAVFYLKAPRDRTQAWSPVELHHEPTVHRMHWIKSGQDSYNFIVKPLHGRGNKGGEGKGGLILEYFQKTKNTDQWQTRVVSDFMHITHNFHPVNWDNDPEEELIIGGKEGVWYFDKRDEKWEHRQLTTNATGEIRDGKLPNGRRFIVTIEPLHGVVSAVYAEPKGGKGLWERLTALDEKLKDGHALACADLLGIGSDQIVVGWRAMRPKGAPGIKLFTPTNRNGTKWSEQLVSGPEVAVEDLKIADINGDGKLDIIAAARQTKNLKIFVAR